MDLQLKVGITMFILLYFTAVTGMSTWYLNITSSEINEMFKSMFIIQLGIYIGTQAIWGLIRLWTI